MIKAKPSKRSVELMKRMGQVPRIATPMIMSKLKADALGLVRNFHEGIKNRSFNLIKLEDGTIARKKADGMERPTTPLYGLGDEKKKNSYINMLRIRQLKNGWRVQPSIGKHHAADITLRLLYFVHEFGTIITGRNGALIRIPPRPALYRAYRRTLMDKAAKERSKVVKAAIARYIREGKDASIKQARAQYERGLQRWEQNAAGN
jgi:DNA-binding cell septation regulator SpoVG